MKLHFIFFTFSLFSLAAYSQRGVYLTPHIENKFYANTGDAYSIITQQGFTIPIKPVNFYHMRGFSIGISIGYRVKNIFAQVGLSQDGSNSGYSAYGMRYSPTGGGYVAWTGSKKGILYTKYPVRVGIRLLGNDSLKSGNKKRWECFLYGGIDFLKRPGNGVEDSFGTNYITSTQDTLFLISKSEVGAAKSYLATIGIMLKGYNKRNRNIFNLGIHYSQGHDIMSWQSIQLINYDGITYWGAPIKSKGSGLYINISKDIYLSNIFK